MKRELIFLRAFAVATVIGMVAITSLAFKETGNKSLARLM